MDLQQLRYVVTVAETGSITAAARRLFMGQPNLSRTIRELEKELGISLFERTPRGVAPTRSGESFLAYARSILEQVDKLEAMYRPDGKSVAEWTITGPRASYVARAFGRVVHTEGHVPLCARYREASPTEVIGDVTSGAARLGIVRWQAQDVLTLESLLRENSLSGERLWEFDRVVVMYESHPLAAQTELSLDALQAYPELVYGDLTPALSEYAAGKDSGKPHGCIAVFDRGGLMDLLREVTGSYMWVSPAPAETLALQHLVQRPCRGATRYRDVLVRRPGTLSAAEMDFVNVLRREIRQMETA